MVRLALAGDTMLGRRVGERLRHRPPGAFVTPELIEVVREADLFVLNLECPISDRGEPWSAAFKHWFRAPPQAVDLLTLLGVDCVTLANNHALDFGCDALLDTISRLHAAGISTVGAGADVRSARAPAVLEHDGFRLSVLGVADHERNFAAGRRTPGIAFADLPRRVDRWLGAAVRDAARISDAVLVTPHWGPNWTSEPVRHVRRAAAALRASGASLVAGHSAHTFHGVAGPVLFDLGDLLRDFRVDRGLLWIVDFDAGAPVRLEAIPLALGDCETGLARGRDAVQVAARFTAACAALGTEVREEQGRLVVAWSATCQDDG